MLIHIPLFVFIRCTFVRSISIQFSSITVGSTQHLLKYSHLNEFFTKIILYNSPFSSFLKYQYFIIKYPLSGYNKQR